MQDYLDNFFFGCARLQPKPMTSPATILPNKVLGYTIEAFGEKAGELNEKLQWRSARFYFQDIDEPLEILAPNLRTGYTDPCPVVCSPVFRSNGKIEFIRRDNPYFSDEEWEQGLNDLFNVIRLHHHLDGANGKGKLLKSTSYFHKEGIQTQWYETPLITKRDQLRQSILQHLSHNPHIFDQCILFLNDLGVDFDRKPTSFEDFHQILAGNNQLNDNPVHWARLWGSLKQWWSNWAERFLSDVMIWPSDEARNEVLLQEGCEFKRSFYGQLLVEETMPMIIRGLLWQMASQHRHQAYSGSGLR